MNINIKDNINNLQNKINEFRNNGITNSYELEMKIINLMPEFYDQYPTIVKRFCREEENQDNTFLYKMIDSLELINKGEQTMAETEIELSEELANKYLYPIINNLKK